MKQYLLKKYDLTKKKNETVSFCNTQLMDSPKFHEDHYVIIMCM